MEKYYNSRRSSLLLLQPQPLVVSKVRQAAMPLNCHVNTATDEVDFFRYFQNNFINPFGIFGEKPVSCLVLDMTGPEKKISQILGKLEENLVNIPPVIGLCQSSKYKNGYKGDVYGFDEMVVFPASTLELRNVLRKYIELGLHQSGANGGCSLKQSLEEMPVIELKTYHLFSEMAQRQKFSLNALLNLCLGEMETIIRGLIRGFEYDDNDDCKRYCQSIISLARTLGASQVALAAKNMEAYIKEEKWADAGYWLPVVIEKFLILKECLPEMPQKNLSASIPA